MAVISRALKAIYFDITKVGSSSLKETLWELNHGASFKERSVRRVLNNLRWRLTEAKLVPPRNIHVQNRYRTQFFWLSEVPEEYIMFMLVRDPVARMKSAWKDKVHRNQFRWYAKEMDIENEGLPLDTTSSKFVDHFREYRAISRPALSGSRPRPIHSIWATISGFSMGRLSWKPWTRYMRVFPNGLASPFRSTMPTNPA